MPFFSLELKEVLVPTFHLLYIFPTFCLCKPSHEVIPNVFLFKSIVAVPDKVQCVREDPPLRVPALGEKSA